MELFCNESHYVLNDGGHCLWINRKNCSFTDKLNITSTPDMKCMGVVYGYIGKLVVGDSDPHLLFIRESSRVGVFHGSEIFKINTILILPLQKETEAVLEMCFNFDHQTGKAKLPNPVGTKGRTLCKTKVPPVKTIENPQSLSPKSEKLARIERRILDEVQKMFSEANSFYYSHTFDITNSLQRQDPVEPSGTINMPLWYRADLRFFWNHYMMLDLIESNEPKLNRWIIPILQGFIQTDRITLSHLSEFSGSGHPRVEGEIDIWIISRRSRHRAGTRYLRRGIDEDGHVANYVETEQLLVYRKHTVSFVQTRGSVPVFWSQPGYRYRPPPRIDRGSEDNFMAYKKHMEEEANKYGTILIINLVEKTGKEKILGDAYAAHTLHRDSKGVIFVSFDFHDHCRGMHFENVQLLIDRVEEQLRQLQFAWKDDVGLVMKQNGVCRVNCVDCLDRTNVVQTAIAKYIMSRQLNKLGILMPEVGLPDRIIRSLQSMWANNGDTISRQYAGTNALKGDYTRTGERRFAISALRDGMNSANRYYRNRFLDASRQAAIDVQLGVRKDITEDELQDSVKVIEEKENTPEQIKSIIDDTKKCIIPKFDVVLGAWGLVNGRENAPDVLDVDTIFILTETHYYVTGYDCQMDSITDTEKVNLKWIKGLELGNETLDNNSKFWGLFGTTKQQPSGVPLLKITYSPTSDETYSHFFRSSSVRFFNNVCVLIKNPEEMHEGLKMIADSLEIASGAQGKKVTLVQTQFLSAKEEQNVATAPSITSWVQRYFRNVESETDLVEPSFRNPVISVPKMKSKYFRRFGAIGSKPKEDEKPGPLRKHGEHKKKKNERVTDPGLLDDDDQSDSTILVQQSKSKHMFSLIESDLVLQSCGIISTSSSSLNGNKSKSGSPSMGISRKALISELSIDSTTCTHLDNLTLTEQRPSLFRHRHSLPTNSLEPNGNFMNATAKIQRSVTPEITINEEPIVESVPIIARKSTNLTKRICKSNEDVTCLTKTIAGTNIKGITCSKDLLNTGSGEPVRSTSDLDIFGNSTQILMKESRSDNAIKRTNNPFQRFSQNQPFKRDLVFAPLGKLARGMQNIGVNYLHPKKLRDTFKSATTTKEAEALTAEEVEELRILEEKKMNSNTLFIDI